MDHGDNLCARLIEREDGGFHIIMGTLQQMLVVTLGILAVLSVRMILRSTIQDVPSLLPPSLPPSLLLPPPQQAQDDASALSMSRPANDQYDATSVKSTAAGSSLESIALNDNPTSVVKESGTPSSSVAIFYNLYVPAETEAAQRLVTIIDEQIKQIRSSKAFSISDDNQNNAVTTATLYYTTIGNENFPISQHVEKACHNASSAEPTTLHCQHLEPHYPEGHEERTLHHLHDYCNQHTNATVIYLHPKGSFHPHPSNDAWRRYLTQAAVSTACVEHITQGTCNVCGLKFDPIWTMFFPGNMWTASCRYVRHLLPIPVFQKRMEKVEKHARHYLEAQRFRATLYPFRDDTAGTGRYTNEHWIGSHPSLRPCDLSTTEKLKPYFNERRPPKLKWAMAPRHGVNFGRRHRLNSKAMTALLLEKSNGGSNNSSSLSLSSAAPALPPEEERLREYFLLPGFLFKWAYLYENTTAGTLPPDDDSWVWRWFPDGNFWKRTVRQYGGMEAALVHYTDS